jgi:hypothetical protein
MAFEQNPYAVKISLVAAADYSDLSNQFKLVKLSSPVAGTPGATLSAAATDRCIGVLQNTPKANFEAEVTVSGVCKVRAGAGVAVGAPLMTDGSGQVVTAAFGTDTTKYIIGTALTACNNAGEIITAAVSFANAGRGA